MAVNPLSLSDVLRPWRCAGISHLLMDGAQGSHAGGWVPPAAHTGQNHFADLESPPAPVIWSGETPEGRPAAPKRQTDPSASKSALKSRPAPPGKAKPQAPDASLFVPFSGIDDDPVETWPAPWQDLLKKTRPAPLLWSYAELATDLLAPDPDSRVRSSLLRSLISAISLPGGSSAFWPLLLEQESGFANHAQAAPPFICSLYFWAGLSILNPKTVIIFGAQAAQGGAEPVLFTQVIIHGRAFVYLPPLMTLDNAPGTQQRTAAFLRSILGTASMKR